jgi:glycosyltransferase involved in cell wall biosynthesis
LRSNPVVSDSRVEKEVKSLTSHGYKLTILAWDREGKHKAKDTLFQARLYRFELSVAYQRLAVIAFYPFFWLWIVNKLIKNKPAVVHACDLDTVLPALFYKFLSRRCRVIFDVFDNYGLMIEEKSAVLGRFVKAVEFILSSMPDVLITVSKDRLYLFNPKKPSVRELILNSPPDYNSIGIKSKNNASSSFTVTYAGTLSVDRGLIQLAEATKNIPDVQVMLAGRIVDAKLISNLRNYPHVKYVGELSFNEALKFFIILPFQSIKLQLQTNYSKQ